MIDINSLVEDFCKKYIGGNEQPIFKLKVISYVAQSLSILERVTDTNSSRSFSSLQALTKVTEKVVTEKDIEKDLDNNGNEMVF